MKLLTYSPSLPAHPTKSASPKSSLALPPFPLADVPLVPPFLSLLSIAVTPITIPCGPHNSLTGTLISDSQGNSKCRRFCQIPYAENTEGEGRWRAPRKVDEGLDWRQVDGRDFGNITCQPTYHIGRLNHTPLSTHIPTRNLSESSLTCNIWTPSHPPSPTTHPNGYPVFVYLHGGWLQIGNPAFTDKNNPADLLAAMGGNGDGAGMEVVIVAVAYRLSLFGFLASKEIAAENLSGCAGNFGFLDQRMGMEWVADNIQYFGGNPDNITLGGPSAGAYSTHFQLCYELNFPHLARPLIKRLIQYSNAIPAQPKTIQESQEAFDGLVVACGIDMDESGEEKMRRLREVKAEVLMEMCMKLKIHTFRAVTDDHFVHRDTMKRLVDGTLARQFKQRDLSIIIGEVDKEELLYSCTNPPTNSAELVTQLQNYYKTSQVLKILKLYDIPDANDLQSLHTLYGKMVADGQVYVPSRVFVKTLFEAGVGMDRILRYRMAWKPEGMRKIEFWPGEVTHSDDTWAWWYSKRYGFTSQDCEINRDWLAPIQHFYNGDTRAASSAWWGSDKAPRRPDVIRILKDRVIVVKEDDRWERALGIAEAVRDEQLGAMEVNEKENKAAMGNGRLFEMETGKNGTMIST